LTSVEAIKEWSCSVDFAQKINELASRSLHASQHAMTEEATKTAVVLPLLQTLGFDVFNLDEVVPEFVADVGIKKGEKIDFAVKIGGKVTILVEAKPISMSLGSAQYSQLYRYFGVSGVRLAILTNGRDIWFFSDIDDRNKMDKKPFFTFDLQSFDGHQVQQLSKFQKTDFQIDVILEAASALRYVKAAAGYLKEQLADPTDEFMRMIGRRIHEGTLTKTVIEQLRPAIQAALDEVIRDRIQDKLNVAFRADPAATESSTKDNAQISADLSDVETTDDERQAFLIVRAIAARLLPIERVTMRDSKSYCAVFIDDNNRKPVCRFYFNNKKNRSLGLLDAAKVETRVPVEGVGDIYKHAAAIESAVKAYI
jgi:predicted type IV restriction endonuclease